jgi:hypothetical protein
VSAIDHLTRSGLSMLANGVPQASYSLGAIEEANRWTDAARPIIRAMFALEDIDLSKVEGIYTLSEARGYITEAHGKLRGMLDGIRDEFLCDQRRDWNPLMGEVEAAQVDAFNDWLNENTVTVKAAIAAEVEAFNASYFGGRA